MRNCAIQDVFSEETEFDMLECPVGIYRSITLSDWQFLSSFDAVLRPNRLFLGRERKCIKYINGLMDEDPS